MSQLCAQSQCAARSILANMNLTGNPKAAVRVSSVAAKQKSEGAAAPGTGAAVLPSGQIGSGIQIPKK